MKKVYKLTFIPLLSLLVLLTTFLVGCSNKNIAENTTPTYPQTYETDTSRNIAQEIVKFIRGDNYKSDFARYYLEPFHVSDSNGDYIASGFEICHFLEENMLELRADYHIFQNHPTIPKSEFFFRLFIPILPNYSAHNFSLLSQDRPDLNEVTLTIPNTPKDFRESPNDLYAIRPVTFDYNEFAIWNLDEYTIEIALQLGKCLTASLKVFDDYLRNALKYFPDKLEDCTALPKEVAQYAILSYFHLPVAVKINPVVKS